jgi:hypothetical protein
LLPKRISTKDNIVPYKKEGRIVLFLVKKIKGAAHYVLFKKQRRNNYLKDLFPYHRKTKENVKNFRYYTEN